jgi:hypothetical protein
VLPDTDAAIVAFYDSHPDLTPLHGGRVGTDLPAGQLPSVRLTNIGGPGFSPWIATVEYQVECWGGTAQEASELARTLYAASFELRSRSVDGGWAITAYPTLLPFWRPDPVTNRPRYITQIVIQATPD